MFTGASIENARSGAAWGFTFATFGSILVGLPIEAILAAMPAGALAGGIIGSQVK
jgi:hypothetical protein